MSERLSASAEVATTSPARYVKQLVSHLGHKLEVRSEAGGERLVFGQDSCLLRAAEGAIELRVTAETAEGRERVENVVGRHLERFAQREGLTVEWQHDT